jgi:hypothetical protein
VRRDFLKGYIAALAAEGEFAGMSSPVAIAKKAVAIFAGDLPAVLGEIAGQIADQAIGAGAQAVANKLSAVASDFAARGVKAVWKDLQAQYWRGLDETARGK